MASTVKSRECILLLASRIKLRAVVAERFVWSSEENAFHDRFLAPAVVVALLGTFCAHLGFLEVEGFVSDSLAVVTLSRTHLAFKYPCVSGFSLSVEETLTQQSPYIAPGVVCF